MKAEGIYPAKTKSRSSKYSANLIELDPRSHPDVKQCITVLQGYSGSLCRRSSWSASS